MSDITFKFLEARGSWSTHMVLIGREHPYFKLAFKNTWEQIVDKPYPYGYLTLARNPILVEKYEELEGIKKRDIVLVALGGNKDRATLEAEHIYMVGLKALKDDNTLVL